MLVLSRKMGERIVVQDDIVITVVGIQGNKVRLGLEAPKSVSIHRQEIYEQIKKHGRRKKGAYCSDCKDQELHHLDEFMTYCPKCEKRYSVDCQ